MEASKIKEILEQHRLWLNGKGGKCADLENAYLCGANLINADLEGAILYIANLQGANLNGAKLTGANLYGASLRGANLTGATLTGASLAYVNLEYANLEDVSFINAYLEGANLEGANLEGANLNGANLEYAILTGAILPDISWIIPGCLVRLNQIKYSFSLYKEDKYDNFVQDSIGFFIQNNVEEGTFDMLLGDRIIRNIPDWVKYTGLKQIPKNNEG